MASRAKTGGRQVGTPNKLSGQVKAMVAGALDELGGQKWLVKQAGQYPQAFMTLVGKLIPHEVTGPDGGPLQFQKIERIVVDPK